MVSYPFAGAWTGAHLPSFGHEPVDKYTTESVTRGQCDVRPMVTFPVAESKHSLAGTKLYSLLTEVHRYR